MGSIILLTKPRNASQTATILCGLLQRAKVGKKKHEMLKTPEEKIVEFYKLPFYTKLLKKQSPAHVSRGYVLPY